MVAIGICWNGVSRAYIVPEVSKVNIEFFIDFILRPMVQEDIPRLYGERAKDVVFHMDSAQHLLIFYMLLSGLLQSGLNSKYRIVCGI